VRSSPGSEEFTRIFFHSKFGRHGRWGVDRSQSSVLDPVATIDLAHNTSNFKDAIIDPLHVQLFVDHSVLEVFVHSGLYVLSA